MRIEHAQNTLIPLFFFQRNTYPEYIRDVCVFLSKKRSPKTRSELSEELSSEFNRDYWLKKSHAGRITKEKAMMNRVRGTIKGAIELGFFEVQSDNTGNESNDRLELSYPGKLLAHLGNSEINTNTPKKLGREVKAFFSAYLLKFPTYRITIDILREKEKEIPLGQSVCKKCGYKEYRLSKFKRRSRTLICPTCNVEVEICLNHMLQLRTHRKHDFWWALNFTKTLHEPLHIFEFPKISRLDGIKLKDMRNRQIS